MQETPGSIPGSERSTGEGIGYPLQFSWAYLVAQLVKNVPAMRETRVRFLGQEDYPGEGQYSGLENSKGSQSRTPLNNFHFQIDIL